MLVVPIANEVAVPANGYEIKLQSLTRIFVGRNLKGIRCSDVTRCVEVPMSDVDTIRRVENFADALCSKPPGTRAGNKATTPFSTSVTLQPGSGFLKRSRERNRVAAKVLRNRPSPSYVSR